MKKLISIVIATLFFSPFIVGAVSKNTSIPWVRITGGFTGNGEHPTFASDQVIIGASAALSNEAILDVEGSQYVSGNIGLACLHPSYTLDVGCDSGANVGINGFLYAGYAVGGGIRVGAIGSFVGTYVANGDTQFTNNSGSFHWTQDNVNREDMTLTLDGNLGLGTTSPYSRLSVAGTTTADVFEATTTATSTFAGGIKTNLLNITSSTASSTFANGITLTKGCFAINSVCLSSGPALPVSIANGGTNAASYASNVLIGYNGTSFTATGTPQLTVGNILATSSTATSSISTRTGFNTSPLSSIHGGYGQLSITQKNDLDAGIVMKALPGQTGDFIYTTDSVGNPLQRFTGQGYIMTNRFADITDPSNNYFILNNGGQGIFQTLNGLLVQAFGAPNPTLTVRLNSGQTTNGFELRDFGLTTLLADINSKGGAYFANNTGIGTTSPYASTSIQSNNSTGDAFVIATSSKNAIAGYDNDGHRFTSGPAPAISSCGTGTGTVVGDDQGGTITTATAATACTATFSKAYRNTPVCTVTDDSLVGFADISSVSTSAVTFGISSALTGGHLYYSCSYHQ